MNRFEFKEVLKEEQIRDPYTFTKGRYDEHEDVYYWNDLTIYFNGTYYCVVKGYLPSEVALKLYELDLLEENYHANFKVEHLNTRDDNVLLESYHVFTVEGLVTLIEVYRQFVEGKLNNKVEIDDKVLNIKNNILKLSRANINNNQWVNESSINSHIYNTTVVSTKDGLYEHFRESVDKFDKSINPFLNEDLDNINDKFDLLNMKYSIDYNTNNCNIKMYSEDSRKEIEYVREKDGFHYVINLANDNKDLYTCTHYFTKSVEGECTGEVIKISKQSKYPYVFTINLTNGTYRFNDGKITPISLDVLCMVTDYLDNYSKEAEDIYKNSIKKGKKLVK